MTDARLSPLSRRAVLSGAAALTVAGPLPAPALGQGRALKIGLMLPYTGTYARLGQFIDAGFRLFVDQKGGKLGGREVFFVQVDDESKVEAAAGNMNRLIGREKVDVVIGSVHSGVAMVMVKLAREDGTPLIIPNAGANEATGPQCAPNIFRTSFSNWQVNYPAGQVMANVGIRNVVTVTWNYTAGAEMIGAFSEAFVESGGKIVESLTLPFPETGFQPLIDRIAQLRPDGVFAFFAGGGAVKFVQAYAAAGLNKVIPLYGAGFLTDGTLEAQGEAANGIRTTLHYADNLDHPANLAFLKAFRAATGKEGNIYAVQGFDAAALLDVGLNAVGGDAKARDAMIAAMAAAKLDSPRGPLSFNKAHNPIQNIYLREVRGGRNELVGVAQAALGDPARGCRLA